ncbi:fibronectin type III domain-containing protein [Dactylosporangium sp. NPDC050688]|uniref:fibronectin type III domain-containing protein n=1 Tax=Dactylosporangium sp. NPDC050688 TaxID=3157217 RepID=UPI0033DE6947
MSLDSEGQRLTAAPVPFPPPMMVTDEDSTSSARYPLPRSASDPMPDRPVSNELEVLPSPVPRRRLGARRRLLAFVAVVVVSGLVYLVPRLTQDGSGERDTASPTSSAVVDSTPATVPQIAPEDVRLADERVAVTLTWRDQTAGEAVFYVLGAPAGGTPSTLANAARGTTTVRVNGLNPDVNYCFVLLAVLSVDEMAPSNEVCTNRFGGPLPTTAPSSLLPGSKRGG